MARTFLNKTNFFRGGGNIPGLQFKFFGDWEKTIKVLQKIGPEVKRAGVKAQTDIAKDLSQRVKKHLRNQDLGWRGLSLKYSRRKAEAGVDSRILIAYGQYYHAIEVWRKGVENMVFVGVKKGKYTYSIWTGRRSKLDIARIATVHEFSSGKRVPKRPLWNPTIREMGGAPGIKKLYINHLVKNLRGKGIPIKQFRNVTWR